MSKLPNWILHNKLATVLFILVVILLTIQFFRTNNQQPYFNAPGHMNAGFMDNGELFTSNDSMGGVAPLDVQSKMTRMNSEVAPAPEISDRMVTTDSYLSLLVNDVAQSVKQSIDYAQSNGGYMVQSNISRPEEGGSGTVVLRIPAEKIPEALVALKALAVSVVSENVEGTDVTDQYVDNEEQLRILESNKARFEQLMENASEIEDIIRIQQEIFILQNQIDAIKGRQNYLEKTSEMAKVTLYMSTDELALPYAPTEAWRPEVIFKTAVRSLVGSLRDVASILIWIGVYALIWIPILVIFLGVYFFVLKRKR